MVPDETKTFKIDPDPPSITLAHQQALLKLAQQEGLLGSITQTLLKDDSLSTTIKNLPGTSRTSSDRTHPTSQPDISQTTQMEVALEKVSNSIEQWSRDARDHHIKLNKLMQDRNHLLEEANSIQRERLKLERLRFELVKQQDTEFKAPLHES